MNPELIAKLKAEIAADPDGRYAKKTSKELVDLINNGFNVEEQKPAEVVEEVVKNTVTVTKDAPVYRVVSGIAGGPNSVTEEDIIAALK